MAAGIRRSSTVAHFFGFLLFLPGWSQSLERTKRELKFPKGATIALTAALATHYPEGPLTEGLAHVLEFDFGFPFPDKIAYKKADDTAKKKIWVETQYWDTKYKNYGVKKFREKRESSEMQKCDLLRKMENIVMRLGYDGYACVSRFQCELQQISENSLVEELLLVFFKPTSYPDEKSCKKFAEDCPVSFLHVFLHSQQNFKQ